MLVGRLHSSQFLRNLEVFLILRRDRLHWNLYLSGNRCRSRHGCRRLRCYKSLHRSSFPYRNSLFRLNADLALFLICLSRSICCLSLCSRSLLFLLFDLIDLIFGRISASYSSSPSFTQLCRLKRIGRLFLFLFCYGLQHPLPKEFVHDIAECLTFLRFRISNTISGCGVTALMEEKE